MKQIRRFQPVSVAAGTLGWFVKNWLNERVDAPSKVSLRLPIGETFSREANGTRGATFAAPTGGFMTDF